MDFQKLGKVIWILGIVVLLYGGFQAVSNEPEKVNYINFDNPLSQGGRERASQREQAEEENVRRYGKQDDAVKILIAGGIVVIAGLLMEKNYSLNNKE